MPKEDEITNQKDKAGLLSFGMRKVILVDLQPWGTSVNSRYCSETKQHLNGIFVKSVLLENYLNLFLHDNARPHSSVLVPPEDFTHFGLKLLPNRPYYSDLNQIFTCLVAYMTACKAHHYTDKG